MSTSTENVQLNGAQWVDIFINMSSFGSLCVAKGGFFLGGGVRCESYISTKALQSEAGMYLLAKDNVPVVFFFSCCYYFESAFFLTVLHQVLRVEEGVVQGE